MAHIYRHISLALASLMAIIVGACSDDSILLDNDGENVVVTYYPTLSDTNGSRASIGDASGINALQVVVFESSNSAMTKVLSLTEDWTMAQRYGIKLSLIEGHSYNILFWAHCGANTAYTVTDDGKIAIDYTDYLDGGFSTMEEMDAFYFVDSMTVGDNVSKPIGMERPFAQVNFADKTTNPVTGTHKAVVTYHNIPSAFNPFSGQVTMTDKNDDADDVQFTFTDFPVEQLTTATDTYNYIASNYLFAPAEGVASLWATLQLQLIDGTPINTFEFKTDDNCITLQQNMKTNVVGNIVELPQAWSVWDGASKSQPDTDTQNRYIIDDAADIAWLCENGESLVENSTFLQTKDIDMNNSSNIASIKLPAGSTYNGGGKIIKNYKNSLFGDATNLTVMDLTIENVEATGVTHVGTLVNTLKGNSSFSNITVNSASATTTNGAAGGMVGYIVRTSEKDRTETLSVSFSDCALNGVSVSGSSSEGKFVGLLSGYDNNENLTFDATCEAADVSIADYTSVYTKANNSVWVEGTLDAKYDGWLGHETYRRAKITFAGVRLAPRWDGSTKTASGNLLLYGGASGKYEVQSPFDLAGVSNATSSPSALYLMENVDMNGQGPDGKYDVPDYWGQSAYTSDDDNYFKSFSTITYLDGNNNGIYNLNINTQKISASLYYGGFIRSTTGTTTHKDITFHNSCVVVPWVVYNNEDKGSAGMLVSNISGTSYTMSNVHTYGCKIFALQKVGGLAARVAATTTDISYCSVNDGYIENYKCEENLEDFAGGLANYYSYGEVGGLLGFVQDGTTITNCHVKTTTIYAYGQDDKALGAVPGRHVSTMIGDIRTYVGGTITITDSSVDSSTQCKKDKHSHTYYYWVTKKTVSEIGKCYYVATADTKGKVIFNGTTIFN